MTNYITRDESAMYYECGYSADNAILLRLNDEIKFITDARYSGEAKEICLDSKSSNIHNKSERQLQNSKHIEIIESSDLLKTAIEILTKKHIKAITYDPTRMNVAEFQALQSSGISLESSPNFTQKMRIVKSESEILILKEAQRLNLKAFTTFADFLNTSGEGKSEKFLHYKIADILGDCGQFPLSFEPIVGINGNAAKPHALPSGDILQNGDSILLDCGLKYERYCADCTRSGAFIRGEFAFSKEQDFTRIDSKILGENAAKISQSEKQKIYDIVRKAQEFAITNLRAGMSGKEIDALARGVIEAAGYGAHFVHSTGHGIGLDIHEMPFISRRSESVIENGMVFSIEPGIYIQGVFGIRIEDLVVVKNGRAEIL